MSRDAFGPNLRRTRVKQGISLESIAARSKIGVELLEGLERNDFAGWPAGIFSRAYVRQYAEAIGVDADATVDEFCRWFPQGDRRAQRVVREHAEIVGHELTWTDDIPRTSPDGDRRGAGSRPSAPRPVPSPLSGLFVRLRRAFGKV